MNPIIELFRQIKKNLIYGDNIEETILLNCTICGRGIKNKEKIYMDENCTYVCCSDCIDKEIRIVEFEVEVK